MTTETATKLTKNGFFIQLNSYTDGTSSHGVTIFVPPYRLVQVLKTALAGDNYKVTKEWIFKKGESVFTLYDWKLTNLYDNDLPSPFDFWNETSKVTFHIGHKEEVKDEAVLLASILESICNS